MSSKQKLLLIDGNSLFYRSFYAMYTVLDSFTNAEGLHTNAIYAFNNMLNDLMDQFKPDYCLVAFDAGKKTFRNELLETYKGNRPKTPTELSEQKPYILDLVKDYGLTELEMVNYEADDIIGTYAKKGQEAGLDVSIVTGDNDLLQLVDKNINVFITIKGVSQLKKYNPKVLSEEYGLTPNQFIEMKALMGDKSDNYQGITKVGPKTAINLLKEYGSMTGIYENIDEISKAKLKENLINDKEQAFNSKVIATIVTDVPVTLSFEDLFVKPRNNDDLRKLYEELNFKSFLAKLDDADSELSVDKPEVRNVSYIELTENNVDRLNELGGFVSVNLETLEPNYHRAEIYGFAIGDENKIFVSDNPELIYNKFIKEFLEDTKHQKVTFDSKADYALLKRMGLNLKNVEDDILIQSYLVNTKFNGTDLGELANTLGYFDVRTDREVYGSGKKIAVPEDANVFKQHMAQKNLALIKLQKLLDEKLKEHSQLDLYHELELPLGLVLSKMEIAGIHVSEEELLLLKKEFNEVLSKIIDEIYKLAGTEFNLNSPKQLGEILFEKMQLPIIKKTKTGYSTSAEVLEELRTASPIVDLILKYRQINKIQSTYVEGLLKVMFPDTKVHTIYQQTLTQTGRLSSTDPNLQNIPIRDEEGRKIRRAFSSINPDWVILSCDYSQIELRVLASISNDAAMVNAFIDDEDIHSATARKIFGLNPDDEITSDMRRKAKATNFGMVYGISQFGLAKNIGVSRETAKQFMKTYFEKYPGVQQYMTDSVEFAREHGFVETISNRRRYIPQIHSKNFSERSFAERTAMNTPIQGSAADIIKIAMLNMDRALTEKNLKSEMLLQVHDELIFQVPPNELDTMKQLVPEIMDSAVKLNVPLKVDVNYGKTWFDVK